MKRFLGIALALVLVLTGMQGLIVLSSAETITDVAVSFDYDNDFCHGADPFTIPFIEDDPYAYSIVNFDPDYQIGYYDLTEEKDLEPGDTLICNHDYRIEVVVAPNDGYFFPSGSGTVNAEIYADQYSFEPGWLNGYIFQKDGEERCLITCNATCHAASIESLSFTVGKPAAGMPAYCNTVTVSGPASVADVNYAALYSGVSWYDDTTGRRLTASDTIVLGHSYEVTILLEADFGYFFYYDCLYKCNGSYVYIDDTTYYAHNDPDRYVEITIDAGTAETVMINEVFVYVEEPYVGGDPYDLDYGTGNAEGYYIETDGVLWYRGTDPLYGGYSYVWNDVPIIEMPIRAEEGYVFFHDQYGGKPHVCLNGDPLDPSDVMLEYDNQRLVITHGYGQPESDVIEEVNVLITPPYHGSCPLDLDVYMPNNSDCYIDRTDMIWFNGDDEVDESFPFYLGDDPNVKIVIKKSMYSTFKTNDEWDVLTRVTVNGKEPDYVLFDENMDLVVFFDFGEVLDHQTIVRVNLYVDEPCVGVDPYEQTAVVTEDSHCSLRVFTDGRNISWNNGEENVEPGYVFTADDDPSFTCFLIPDDGYVFLSDTDAGGNYLIYVTVNGQRAEPAYVGDGVEHRMMTINEKMPLNDEPVEIPDVYVYLGTPYEGCDPYELYVYYPEIQHAQGWNKVRWDGTDEFVDWNGVFWCDASIPAGIDEYGDPDFSTQVLVPGQYYNYGAEPYAQVYIRPNKGYKFTDDTTVYVNGIAVSDVQITQNFIGFEYLFDPITSDDKRIDLVDVLTNPSTVTVGEDPYTKTNTVFGEDPGPNIRPFNHYSLWAQPAIWYRSSVEQEMLSGETYEYGDVPIVDFYLRAHDGYRFNMSRNEDGTFQLTVRVNGRTAEVVDFIGYEGEHVVIRCVFDRLGSPYDINNDGVVTIMDVTALLDFLAGTAELPEGVSGDLDGSGDVTIADVTALLDYLSTAESD